MRLRWADMMVTWANLRVKWTKLRLKCSNGSNRRLNQTNLRLKWTNPISCVIATNTTLPLILTSALFILKLFYAHIVLEVEWRVVIVLIFLINFTQFQSCTNNNHLSFGYNFWTIWAKELGLRSNSSSYHADYKVNIPKLLMHWPDFAQFQSCYVVPWPKINATSHL